MQKIFILVLSITLFGCNNPTRFPGSPFSRHEDKLSQPAPIVKRIDCCAWDVSIGTLLLCEEIKRAPGKKIIDLNGVVYISDC